MFKCPQYCNTIFRNILPNQDDRMNDDAEFFAPTIIILSHSLSQFSFLISNFIFSLYLWRKKEENEKNYS